jgi:hypothetical protein
MNAHKHYTATHDPSSHMQSASHRDTDGHAHAQAHALANVWRQHARSCTCKQEQANPCKQHTAMHARKLTHPDTNAQGHKCATARTHAGALKQHVHVFYTHTQANRSARTNNHSYRCTQTQTVWPQRDNTDAHAHVHTHTCTYLQTACAWVEAHASTNRRTRNLCYTRAKRTARHAHKFTKSNHSVQNQISARAHTYDYAHAFERAQGQADESADNKQLHILKTATHARKLTQSGCSTQRHRCVSACASAHRHVQVLYTRKGLTCDVCTPLCIRTYKQEDAGMKAQLRIRAKLTQSECRTQRHKCVVTRARTHASTLEQPPHEFEHTQAQTDNCVQTRHKIC